MKGHYSSEKWPFSHLSSKQLIVAHRAYSPAYFSATFLLAQSHIVLKPGNKTLKTDKSRFWKKSNMTLTLFNYIDTIPPATVLFV